MKHPVAHQISYLALLVALAAPVSAQTENDYDAFGIVDDNIPLDQLVPQDDTLPPPQTFLFEDQDTGAATASLPDVPAAQPDPAPVAAQDPTPALPQIARFSAPADWVNHEIKGITFSAPPDWAIVSEKDDEIVLFGGDMTTHAGPSMAVRFERKSLFDDDEVEILSVDDYLLADGSQYKRAMVHGELAGGKIVIDGAAFETPETNDDDDYTSFMVATFNDDFDTYKETFDQILGTVIIPAAVLKPRPEALAGLVSYVVPKPWSVHNSVDGEYVSFRAQSYVGYIAVAVAGRVAGDQGMDDDVPANASPPEPAQIFGHDAMLQTWKSPTNEFFVGSSMVSGQYSYYRLNKCLPDGAPVGVVIAGAPEFYDGDEFAEAMAGIALSMPEGGKDCAAPSVNSSNSQTPVQQQDTATVEAPVIVPQQQLAQDLASGQLLDVQGVQFSLPESWTAINDSASDKIFTSADGRFTVLAFWWFPDEPLTNYDDISVKQVVNDHEPSTRITSQIGDLTTILNVTERARADETRFVFTVEGSNVSLDELQALHDKLIPTLRFNNVFNPNAVQDDPQENIDMSPPPAPAQTVQQVQLQHTWVTYSNTRFGTQVSYPANLFREMAAPENNDGRTFEGIGGSHGFIVFGQHNIDGLGVRDLIEQDISFGGYDAVTYEKAGNGWYVLSGYKGADIFYRKVLVDEQSEVLHTLEITYPTALKREFDAVVAQMASSFSTASTGSPSVNQPAAAADNERPQMTRRNKEEYTATKK